MKKVFLLLMGMLFLAGCAATAPQQRSGFLGEYYSKLQPVEEGNKDWLRVIFAFAEDSEYKGIDASEGAAGGDA